MASAVPSANGCGRYQVEAAAKRKGEWVMRYLAAVMICTMAISSPALCQSTPASRPTAGGATCAVLQADLTRFEQNLAENYAESVGDNSAPRATLRAIEDQNELIQAQITIDLMRDHRCPMPARAPSMAAYLLPAIECATARLRAPGQREVPACDRTTWQPRAGQSGP